MAMYSIAKTVVTYIDVEADNEEQALERAHTMNDETIAELEFYQETTFALIEGD